MFAFAMQPSCYSDNMVESYRKANEGPKKPGKLDKIDGRDLNLY